MKRLFELEWMGGAAEHHFRKERPGIDALPWDTLDASAFAPELADAARATWTESAFTEYRAVAAFTEVMRVLCEVGAPLDLIGMASGFLADEVVHVELSSRMAMALGGAVPRPVDYAALYPPVSAALGPQERANETVLRVSCVGEALSGRLAVDAMRTTTHPLTRAVLERIVADESLHHRLGGLYFEWASDAMDDAERARLAAVAMDALRGHAPALRPHRDPASPRYRAPIEAIRELGWVESRHYGAAVRAAVRDAVVAPLASYGIALPADEVAALFPG